MDELTKIALVGTSKYAGPITAAENPAAALVAGSASEDREGSLLLRCGARSIYDLAGQRAVAGIEPVAPAPPETVKTASRKLAALLHTAIASGRTDLLIDFLRQMRARTVVLPPEVLPLLLESKDNDLRKSVLPILGERGAWLSRQNPDWSYFHAAAANQTLAGLPEIKRTWDEGTIDHRCAAIATLRGLDPVTARDWVAQVFATEKANQRVRLVESLATGLSDGDEAFLEGCLDDRSSAVGQAAARLLARLPRSALAGRMRGRAAAMLGMEKKGMIIKKLKLVCTPPREIDRDWERDDIPKRAPSGVGERAFWTETVLAAVAPSHWQGQFGLEPPALIAAVVDDSFAGSVLAGWTKAAVEFAASDTASTEWLAPLWRHWAGAVSVLQGGDRVSALRRMQALLPLMPPDRAEAGIVNLFDKAPGWEEVEVFNFLSALSGPWSARFTAAFLATVRRRVQGEASETAYQWAATMARTACAIPADVFPLALAPWEFASAAEPTTWFAGAIPKEIDKFVVTIETRQRFMAELNA